MGCARARSSSFCTSHASCRTCAPAQLPCVQSRNHSRARAPLSCTLTPVCGAPREQVFARAQGWSRCVRRVQRHGVDAVFTCDPTTTARWPSLRTHAREYIRACLRARALARAPWSGQTGGHLPASTTRARARFFAWRLERAAARRTTRAPKRASARVGAKRA